MLKKIPILILPIFIFLYTFKCVAQPIILDLPIPKKYEVVKALNPILIDGIANEKNWEFAKWTDFFIDIEGDKNPSPYYDTRVKLLWDDEFIYFYTELEEEHIWGDITERDAVIFHNNDFEIFIKPNQSQPYYAEFEVNALGTLWELFLAKPYRRNGPVLNQWDVNGTQIGIDIQGTLNDPSDIDKSWNIEIAIPLQAIKDIDRGSQIKEGSVWRLNFSRVQWQHQIEKGIYSRKQDSSGNLLPENNWVWTEQSAIAMHRPEHWGYLFFSEKYALNEPLNYIDDFEIEYQLLFYVYRKVLDNDSTIESYFTTNNMVQFSVNGLILTAKKSITNLGFELTVTNPSKGSISVNQDGYVITQ